VKPLTGRRLLLICAVLAAVLAVVALAALALGVVPIPTGDLLVTLVRRAIGESGTLPAVHQNIVFETRLPRVLLGMLVGAALAVAGAGFQALLRNPLADPYVLGVSSGAALGAILSLAVAPQLKVAMPLAAFAGALLTISGVFLLGRRKGQLDSYTLLLAGIITASFLSAVIMFLMTMLPGTHLRGMAFWLMGDLSSGSPVDLRLLYVVAAVAVLAIYSTSPDLNLLLTGEQEARHLGVDVGRVKLVVYLSASLLTGLAVSVAGAIGYVGLLVPHVMRLVVGSDYRMLLPAAALGGAIVVVLADTLARTVVAPTELPVGAMTAMAGAPVFLFLLRRRLR
jgi:iron complex transport system permease protein